MSMTKKDYELIAAELRHQHELLGYNDGEIGTGESVYSWSCKLWAASLKLANPEFDRAKFLTACGIEVTRERRVQSGPALDEINAASDNKD